MKGIVRSVSGSLRYTSDAADRRGIERGREEFRIDRHRDGCDVLFAHCEIDDDPVVVRDVSYRMGPRHEPLDCFVRIAVGGRFRGSGWFVFSQEEARCEAATAIEGNISQRYRPEHPICGFGSHPISNDGLMTRLYDLTKGRGRQKFELLLSSPDHHGATGPMIYPVALTIEYVGDDRIRVPAGTFDTRHFRYLDVGMPQEHPPYDIWVSNDGDSILVRACVGGYMQTAYDLTSLKVA